MLYWVAALVSKARVLASQLTRLDLPGSVNRHARFVKSTAPSIQGRQRRFGAQLESDQ